MTQKELEEQKKLLREAATAQKGAIDVKIDNEKSNIEAEQANLIADYDKEYNDIIDLANVQKHIAEREVSEAMANAGMTDSGLNRTQQTAIQLSYANAENEARIARQKSVDALASKVREQLGLLESQRVADKANVDSTLTEEIIKLDDKYTEQGNKKYTARNSLISTLNDTTKSDDEKIGLLNSYFDQYGSDSTFTNYAKSYYDKVYNNPASTEEAKKAAAKTIIDWVGAEAVDSLAKNGDIETINYLLQNLDDDALNVAFAKLDANGLVLDETTGTVKQQAKSIIDDDYTGTEAGLSTQHYTNGKNKDITLIKEELKKAFQKDGLKGYLNTLEKYKNTYDTMEMDLMMLETFGKLWLLATGTNEGKENGYNGGGFEVVRDSKYGGNIAGLDADAKIKFGDETKTIGELRSLALSDDLGISRKVMRDILSQYGSENAIRSIVNAVRG